MADSKPSCVQEATLEELLAAVKANIPVAGGSGPCPAEPSFAGDWEVADRDCAERVRKAAAAVRGQLLPEHRSPKEALAQELLAAVEANNLLPLGLDVVLRCHALTTTTETLKQIAPVGKLWRVECAERVRKAAAALRKFLEAG
jgi:hypothetical protein